MLRGGTAFAERIVGRAPSEEMSMRIILKPKGIVLLTLALLTLISVAVLRRKNAAMAPPAEKAAAASQPVELPLVNREPAWKLVTPNAQSAQMKTIPAGEGAGGNVDAMEITVNQATPEKYWLTQIERPIGTGIAANHNLVLHFYARSIKHNIMHAIVEQNAEPFEKAMDERIVLPNTWREYNLTFSSPDAGYANGAAHVCFHLGTETGVIDITGVSLTDLGPA